MLKQLRNFKCLTLIFMSLFWFNTTCYADDFDAGAGFYPDKTKLIIQQIDLLKNRIKQAQGELQVLQKQEHAPTLAADSVSKQLLSQAELDIAVAKSNLDSINIELTECQQAVGRLEKDMQEIQNQLNVFNIFGLKISRNGSPDSEHLHEELENQTALLQLEKTRLNHLQKLQGYADNILQFYKMRYDHIDSLLKSQTVLLLKEQQAKTELGFEQQQSIWLQRLETLKLQLDQSKANQTVLDKEKYEKLQNEIFYVNENVNLTYLQMLIAAYQEQIQQLKISIARGSSITLFNKAADQAQLLGKQLTRLNTVLNGRADILTKRKAYFVQPEQSIDQYKTEFANLDVQYKLALKKVATLNENLVALRSSLDQALQQELSARQGLPALGTKAWLDFGGEILLVPTLAFQIFKSLSHSVVKGLANMTAWSWVFLLLLETTWMAIFWFFSYFLRRIVVGISDHEFGHINLKWLTIKLLNRNLIDVALILNLFWLFLFLEVPAQNFAILINLGLVWLLFKSMVMIARLCLVETVHDRDGHDVRLYRLLKRIFLIGGIVTALTVFMHQMPVIYEVKDLFDRLFLLFLLISSVFLLKQWHSVVGLMLPHIDERRT